MVQTRVAIKQGSSPDEIAVSIAKLQALLPTPFDAGKDLEEKIKAAAKNLEEAKRLKNIEQERIDKVEKIAREQQKIKDDLAAAEAKVKAEK